MFKKGWLQYSAYLQFPPRIVLLSYLISYQVFGSFIRIFSKCSWHYSYFQWLWSSGHPSCHPNKNRCFCLQLVTENPLKFPKGYKLRLKSHDLFDSFSVQKITEFKQGFVFLLLKTSSYSLFLLSKILPSSAVLDLRMSGLFRINTTCRCSHFTVCTLYIVYLTYSSLSVVLLSQAFVDYICAQ